MNLTTEQLAELIAGIAKAQQAIVDAIDSDSGGWKNTHLLPKINTAANMRLPVPRLIDVPARVLMRSQGRVPMDVPSIVRMLQEAMGVPPPAPGAAPVAVPETVPVAAPVAAAAGVVAGAAVASAAQSTPTAGGDDLSNFFDT